MDARRVRHLGRGVALIGFAFAASGCDSAHNPCPVPTVADCYDPAWLHSDCGGEERRRIAGGEPTAVCPDLCDVPDAAQCLDPTWQASACGLSIADAQSAWAEAYVRRARGWPGAPSAAALEDLEAEAPCADASRPEIDAHLDEFREAPVPPGGLDEGDGRQLAIVEPYDRSGQTFSSLGTLAHSRFLARWTQASSAAPAVDDRPQPINGSVPDAWALNGTRVGSCEEYVYERYYDYSRFEDTVLNSGDDYRAWVEAAFDGPQSIGVKGLDGEPQTAFDGTPIDPQVAFPDGEQPRNIFFTLPLPDPDARARLLGNAAIARVGDGCGSTFDGPILCDDRLDALPRAGKRQTHRETWAWHARMDRELAEMGYLDEELHLAWRKVTAFEKMLARRNRVVAEMTRGLARTHAQDMRVFLEALAAIGQAGDERVAARGARDHLNRRLDAQRDIEGGWTDPRGMGHTSRPARPAVDPDGFEAGGAGEVGPEVVTYDRWADDGEEESLGLSPLALDRLLELQRQLHQVDQEIRFALYDALESGCLDGEIGPCDWSPRLLAERLAQIHAVDREMALRRCQETVGGDFDAIEGADLSLEIRGRVYRPVVTVDGEPVECFVDEMGRFEPPREGCRECNAWTASTSAVDRYLDCVDAYRQMILYLGDSVLGEALVTVDGELRLQGSTAERISAGNDRVRLSLSYGAGWSLGEFPAYVEARDNPDPDFPPLCRLTPEAYAYTRIDSRILGTDYPLVDASMHHRIADVVALRAGAVDSLAPDHVARDRVEATVLGQELFGLYVGGTWTEDINVVRDLWIHETDREVGRWPVRVLGIPVSVGISLVGRVSLDYDIGGVVADDCDIFRLQGQLTPRADLDLMGSLSLDLWLVEAGVAGWLKVIDLQMPHRATLALGVLDAGETGLRLNAASDLIANLLSGRLTAYGRALSWTRHYTFYAWDGTGYATNVYALDWAVPLLSLRRLYDFLEAMAEEG